MGEKFNTIKELIRKIQTKFTTPTQLYGHDCLNCTFLGTFEGDDLYHCTQGSLPTVIARHSSDLSDYTSGMLFAKSGSSKPLAEALKRSREMGIA